MNIDSTTINQFVAFSKFANDIGNAKAVAQLEGNGPVSDITRNTADKPYAWGRRSSANVTSNLNTRALFLKTVENMFGGADRIPREVRSVMKLTDFNDMKGHPLTARRILAVTNAITDYIDKSNEKVTVDGKEMDDTISQRLRFGWSLDIDSTPDDNSINNVANSINSVDDNIIKEDEEPKPQVDPKQQKLLNEYNVLKGKVEAGTATIKDRTRYFQLEGTLNGRGVMQNLGIGQIRGGGRNRPEPKIEKVEPNNIEKQTKDIQVLQKRKPKKIRPNLNLND